MPTRPPRSPTTTSDEKLKRRPPLTVAEVRYTPTVVDSRLVCSSSSSAMGGPEVRGQRSEVRADFSKFQSAFARRVGKDLDAAVIAKTVAIEDDLRYSGLDGALGDAGADGFGRRLVSARANAGGLVCLLVGRG